MKTTLSACGHTVLLRFIIVFFLFIFFIIGISLEVLDSNKRVFENREKNQLEFSQYLIESGIQDINNDLEFMFNRPLITEYLSSQNAGQKKTLVDEFILLSNVKKSYDQIRILDSTGMEKVRVNFDNGKPFAVSDDELQFKGKRYYFTDTYALSAGEYFMSPFDLNIEEDRIEQPLKPALRFGVPLYDKDGVKQGVGLINYLGSDLLNKLDFFCKEEGCNLMLLNSEGYWIKGSCSEDEWGFMYPDRKDITYGNRFPEEWSEISEYVSGQFYSDAGLVTYSTIYPLREIGADGKSHEQRLNWLEGKRYAWKIVSHVDKDKIDQSTHKIKMSFLKLAVVVSISLFLVLVVFRFGKQEANVA